MTRHFSRRELGALVGAGALGMLGNGGLGAEMALQPGRVGLAALGDGSQLDAETAARLIDAALSRAVAGAATGIDAAKRLFRSSDTVGIKINCLAGPMLSPRVALVEALVELLVAAGVARRKVIVFERSSRELERAGFVISRLTK